MDLFRKKDAKNTPTSPRKQQSLDETSAKTMVRFKTEVNAKKDMNEYTRNLRKIINRIHSSPNLDTILIDLKDDILSLIDAERITIYAISEDGQQIYSKFKDGKDIQEIRVAIDNSSIAGYVANNKKPLAIQDAYNAQELKDIDPMLRFNRDFDLISGFRTKHVLAVPAVLEGDLLGVIQIINKKSGVRFLDEDKQALMEMAETLAIAFNNHRKFKGKQLSKYDFLVAENVLLPQEIERAVQMARQTGEILEQILMKDFKVSKKNIGSALSNFYGVPFFEFKTGIPIPFDILNDFEPAYLRTNNWVPINLDDGKLTIAIDNPKALDKIDDIKRQIPARYYSFCVALPEDIERTIDYFWGANEETQVKQVDTEDKLAQMMGDLNSQATEETDNVEEASESDNAIIRMVHQIIKEAYEKGASDIHIEPSAYKSEKTMIRLRIDGDCQEYQRIPASAKRAIVSRLKVMAGLDIANRRFPQDGKIQFKKFGGPDIELRLATLPTINENESAVLRILASSEPIPVDKVGMRPPVLEAFKKILAKPYGIVLVVGPTGSGKTTTLHSALSSINTPDMKIWTAEDPVEITQKGLCQVQVNPKAGYTFATAMRAFLRADPDVIMVGEMRDCETASIAIEASLTGHLVFSTLHTNSAPETIVRLLDIGIDPFNFADALLGILAQRLVRTLCSNCREPFKPNPEFFNEIAQEYGKEGEFQRDVPKYPEHLYRPKGCERCSNKGYKGRMGIHELLLGSDEITAAIHKKITADALRLVAIEQGMKTLKQDGILKALDGKTDLVQVRSVCIK